MRLFTDVIFMPKTTLPSIEDITRDFPKFSFEEDEVFHWSPKNNCVYFNPENLNSKKGVFQLLHEIGHALLAHVHFGSGVQLLKMEAEAWQKARELAQTYKLKIESKQIEHCLDSYRDWLHIRSKCPSCKSVSVETAPNQYHCFNCHQKWTVPTDQRTRNYRLRH